MATVPGSSSAGGPVLEVLAHERLMPALRSAFEYVLAVAAQRHPWLLLRVHSLREELFAALSCALEAHSLLRHGASFSEHFYFMQRGGVRSARRAGWSPLDALADRFAAVRGPRRLLLEVLVLVAPLYLRAKLDPLLSADALADERDGEGRGGGGDGGDAGGGPSGGGAGRRRRALSLAYRAVCAGLDVLHLWRASARRPPLSRRTRLAAWRREVLSGLLLPRRRQLLLFLSRRSPHASLAERLLRYRLLPAAAPAAADGGGGGGAFRGSRREIGARLLELPLQHARQLLLLSAFGYRLLGWLHQPDDAPPLAAPLLPPPPPPPPLAPGKRPPLPGACGECAMSPMEQPTAAPSGYVFCAKCITRAARCHGRCPLTHAPATLPSLVRLYETSRAPPAPPAEEAPALSSREP